MRASLNTCVVADMLQAIPVSMTGRIFYWNMTTFNKAGITEVPKTLDDLMAAGAAFQSQLGDDYYPLHLGGYDRMIMMVFYLESIYGKDWADPSTSTLNYTADEIAEGLDFIKSLVDNHVVMPLPTYYGNNGFYRRSPVQRVDHRPQDRRHPGVGFFRFQVSGRSGRREQGWLHRRRGDQVRRLQRRLHQGFHGPWPSPRPASIPPRLPCWSTTC